MKKKYNIPKITIAMINGEVVCFDPQVNQGTMSNPIGVGPEDLAKNRGSFEDDTDDNFWTTK